MLACPRCHQLLFAPRLKSLASAAEQARQSGNLSESARLWREALDLLPPGTQQHAAVTATLESLSHQIDSLPAANATSSKNKARGLAGIGALIVFLLTKAKLLLLGLTNLPTLLSMFLSIGVYWAAFGWKFAIGLVLSIYVHEMGHVAALRRFGFKATAPMFIPGLGALIRLKQHPLDAREDARIGLAGPLYGLAAATFCAAVWHFTGSQSWGAIAKIGAWINLFNLIPIGPLDGGRGFRALSRLQSWLVLLTAAILWYYSREGMLALIAIVSVFRAFGKPATTPGDNTAVAQFLFLLLTLTALTLIPINLQ
jgi:Zn-dependent protease